MQNIYWNVLSKNILEEPSCLCILLHLSWSVIIILRIALPILQDGCRVLGDIYSQKKKEVNERKGAISFLGSLLHFVSWNFIKCSWLLVTAKADGITTDHCQRMLSTYTQHMAFGGRRDLNKPVLEIRKNERLVERGVG